MTDNHQYNTPEEGATDWHVPLNENFESIDTDVEIRDLEANITQYEPKDGAKFSATDTNNVFFGDGSAWEKAYRAGGDIDELASGKIVYVSATTGRKTLDPSTSTTPIDDAIQNIYDNEEGGTVLLPCGTIDHDGFGGDGGINMRPGIQVIGQGPNPNTYTGTQIRRTSAGDLFRWGGSGTTETTIGAHLKNVYLNGRYKQLGNATGIALNFVDASGHDTYNMVVESVWMDQWGASAIKRGTNVYAITFKDVNMRRIDPANDDTNDPIIDWVGGVGTTFVGTCEMYGHTTPASGSYPRYGIKGGPFTINDMRFGDTIRSPVFHELRYFAANSLYYEPANFNNGSPGSQDWAFCFGGNQGAHVGTITLGGGGIDFDNLIHLTDINQAHHAATWIPYATTNNSSGLSADFEQVIAVDDIGPGVVYQGPVSEVNNASGSTLSNPIVCLSDLTKKVSTGVGYDGGAEDSQL